MQSELVSSISLFLEDRDDANEEEGTTAEVRRRQLLLLQSLETGESSSRHRLQVSVGLRAGNFG